MPNWCSNNVTVSSYGHPDLAKKLKDALSEDKELFMQFVPRPKEFDEGEAWYMWNIENWGTKWDAQPHNINWLDDDSVSFSLETAWSPPIEFYKKMEELGYHVEAYYIEEGMAFVGYYEAGYDDYYEYGGMTAEEMENKLPEWADVEFGLIERTRDEESDREAEEWNDYLSDLDRTEWYSGKINPVREGQYETKTKEWPFPHFSQWNGEKWVRWPNDKVKVTEWRGITEEQYLEIQVDNLLNEQL